MIEKITDNSGHVVYEHKDEGTQVYSPATASIMNDLLRSVVDSANTTKFKPTLVGLNPHLASADWVGKTGTTDEFKDSWLIVSTPTVTLSSWTGHDLPAPMTTTSGDNNGNYMANLANALYYANPELFGIGQKFELDPSVIKSKVSEFTGENLAQLPIMVLSSIHLAKQRLHTMPKMVHHKVPINLGSVEQTAITLLTGEILLHVPLQIITTTIKQR